MLAWADELTEIKTICHCGRKATFNARMRPDGTMELEGDQIEIGGNCRYVSVCRRHFHQAILHPQHDERKKRVIHDGQQQQGLQRCDSGLVLSDSDDF